MMTTTYRFDVQDSTRAGLDAAIQDRLAGYFGTADGLDVQIDVEDVTVKEYSQANAEVIAYRAEVRAVLWEDQRPTARPARNATKASTRSWWPPADAAQR